MFSLCGRHEGPEGGLQGPRPVLEQAPDEVVDMCAVLSSLRAFWAPPRL